MVPSCRALCGLEQPKLNTSSLDYECEWSLFSSHFSQRKRYREREMVRTVMLREVDKHTFRDLLLMIKSSWQCQAEDVYMPSPAWQQIR